MLDSCFAFRKFEKTVLIWGLTCTNYNALQVMIKETWSKSKWSLDSYDVVRHLVKQNLTKIKQIDGEYL